MCRGLCPIWMAYPAVMVRGRPVLVELLHIYPCRIQGIGFSSSDLFRCDKIRSRRLKPCLGFRWCSIFAPWCSCSFSIASSTFLRLRLAWERRQADAFFRTGWKLTTPWPSSNRKSIGKSIGQNGGFHGFHGFQKCQDVDSLAEVGPDQGQAWSGTRTTELRRNQIF